MKSFFFAAKEILEVVFFAVLVVFGVRYFLIQPFLVNGPSMYPTFESGDYILTNKISYRFREPERGEVVVFHYPGNPKTYFIKRIIGLPDERVVVEDGKITVYNSETSGQKEFTIKEPYLSGVKTTGSEDIALKSNEYFVLGDNREASFDSRQWGALKKENIIGVVWVRLWPLNKVIAFERPAYGN